MKVKKKEVFTAIKFKKGMQIEGIVDEGPFIPTGGPMDRFADHPDIYVKKTGSEVKDGDWIVTDGNGDIQVYNDKRFAETFEPA